MTDSMPVSSRHLITTPVTADTHPRCGAVILTGTAEGLRARVDLTPLNPAGEIAAVIDRIPTYTLLRAGLVHRDPSRIRDTSLRAAGPVLGEHRCHRVVPAAHRHHSPAPAATATTGECPF